MTAPASDPGRTAEKNELREALARFLWDTRYGQLPEDSWGEARGLAKAIPDGAAASAVGAIWSQAEALLSGPLAPILQETAHLRTENANLRDRVREAEGAAEAMRERCAREAERVVKAPARMIGGMRVERLPMTPRTPREIAAAIRDLPLSPEPQEAGDA